MFKFPNPEIEKVFSIKDIQWSWNGSYWENKKIDVPPITTIKYLTELEDVDISDPYIGQSIIYNGEIWNNESIINSINGSTGDVLALSNIPTPTSGMNFDANLGTIKNISKIEGNNGTNSVLTITGDLIVTGSIIATVPGTIIIGDIEDTNPTDPDNVCGGTNGGIYDGTVEEPVNCDLDGGTY